MKRLLLMFVIFSACVANPVAFSQIITTVAGGGSGSGRLATDCTLCPDNVAMDTAGNLYMTSFAGNRIWKVNTSGILSLIAGTSAMGFSGDGGPATAATMNGPYGIAADRVGNVYFADYTNHRIRKISASGIITTVAGTGVAGYSGDGGPATAAMLYNPVALAIDTNGNLYFFDSHHAVVRYISGGIITTVAGGGVSYSTGVPATSASIGDVYGLAVDKYMNLYIAEASYGVVQKVEPSGMINTIVGFMTGFSGDGGPASSAKLNVPQGLCVDNAGNIFISDSRNHRVRRVNTSGTISTWAGDGTQAFTGDGGPATNAAIGRTTSIVVNKTGEIFLTDDNCRVRKVTAGGIISTYAGGGIQNGVPATSAQLHSPMGVTFDAAGNLYMSEARNNRVRKITPAGTISTYAGSGMCSNFWATSYSGDGGPATAATLSFITSMVTDPAGNMYIADAENNRIRKVSPAGIITTFAGTGVAGYNGDMIPATAADIRFPWGITIDAAGNIYFSENKGSRIRKVNTSGIISTYAGTGIAGYTGDGGTATAAKLYNPYGICMDVHGNLLIATYDGNRIRYVDPSGNIYTLTGNGIAGTTGDGGPATAATVYEPVAITADGAGNVYFSSGGAGIRKIDPSGIVSTYAGNGVVGYIGDGMMATASSLNYVTGLAVDAAKNLYLSDNTNHRLRRINYNHSTGFAGAHTLTLLNCLDLYSIDTLLATIDSDLAQTINWQVISGPSHGTILTTYSAASTGGLVSPSGFVYARTLGYSGSDVIQIKVSDGVTTDVLTINFNVVPPPDAGAIAGSAELCTGITETYTNTATGGVWSIAGPSASISGAGDVTALAAGSDVISYTASNLCGTSVTTYNITVVDCPDGVKHTGIQNNCVTILPNPNNGIFTIIFRAQAPETVNIRITDIIGRSITTLQTITNKPCDLKLNVPPGIYFLNAEAGGANYNGKIMVE